MSAVEMISLPTYRTTYKECYKHHDSLPPIHYHQQPAIEFLNDVLPKYKDYLAPRKFPLIPRGPKRRRTLGKPPLGPGLGTPELETEKLIGKKPIVQTESPFLRTHEMPEQDAGQIVMCPATRSEHLETLADQRTRIPREALERICKSITLSSTTRNSTEEAALPIRIFDVPNSTREKNADMVKLRPRKYEQDVQQWQRVAQAWDKPQIRAAAGAWRSYGASAENMESSCFQQNKLLKKRQTRSEPLLDGQDVGQLAREGRLATPYVLQTPGYAGFLPRSPIDSVQTKQDPKFTSVMKDSYKSFPTDEYQIQTFHHKGPLSRTVTLTYPYNPFNKL